MPYWLPPERSIDGRSIDGRPIDGRPSDGRSIDGDGRSTDERPSDWRPAEPPCPIIDSGLAAGRVDSEDGRAGIGENLCQPPPLLLPLLRAGTEPPELPGLGADPQFELPRVSGRETELFCGPMRRTPAILLCPD